MLNRKIVSSPQNDSVAPGKIRARTIWSKIVTYDSRMADTHLVTLWREGVVEVPICDIGLCKNLILLVKDGPSRVCTANRRTMRVVLISKTQTIVYDCEGRYQRLARDGLVLPMP